MDVRLDSCFLYFYSIVDRIVDGTERQCTTGDLGGRVIYCRFSHDVTKIQTTKLLILLIFYFNEV